MLCLHRVLDLDPPQDLRRKAREAGDPQCLALGQGVADPQAPVVGDADNVAGPGLLGEVAVAREEKHRGLHRHRRPVRMFFNFMPRLKWPEAIRTKAMRSRCCGSILACTLNTKPVTRELLGRDRPRVGRLRAAATGPIRQPGQQFAHAEIIERTAEIDRRQMALAIGLRVEGRAQPARHLDLLAQFGESAPSATASAVSGSSSRCSGPAR